VAEMSVSNNYNFQIIEKKWQSHWEKIDLYSVKVDPSKPKYYVLDMFPYPSGAGLHVGHPLGYIASDIVARYKRLSGFNVLHPMGYDAFGLPAEQYAIQTGQHPAVTTENNIKQFRSQLDKIGFSYDWNREVKTSDENYYKWTQWIFSLFFVHWYNKSENKARPINELISHFETQGNTNIEAHSTYEGKFSSSQWNAFSEFEKELILNQYRLAFINESTVNWCEELGTVLANEEVINGLSERGNHPVIRKKMKQWSLRITAYADRLLEGLQQLDWSDSIKEIQKNWIGKSEGAEVAFDVKNNITTIKIFTTRPDTLFGATFLVLAPEYLNLLDLCDTKNVETVKNYIQSVKHKSEIDRMSNSHKTGVFTGNYAVNPFTKKEIPIWVSDYVLSTYGTGAIMAVPAHDERDFDFAKAFNLEIIPVIKPEIQELELPLIEAFTAKTGICINSDFLNGLEVSKAIPVAIKKIVDLKLGSKKINYKLREAGFARQRYWGEPFPIVYKDSLPQLDNNLPVILPKVQSYQPTGTGASPLASVQEWVNSPIGIRETDTMPGWAGSSWYFLRYTDPKNSDVFADEKSLQYWENVDLYIGGSEHATGHLLYSRFWTKFLYDLGYITFDEPFKKLVNQGMIIGEDGQKMSKRWGNVVNPDDICQNFGADTLRMYEMFLGPLTDSKPWNTNGIEGVSRFLNKLWRMFFENSEFAVSNEDANFEEHKILAKTIKKITQDIESLSFNTSISAFMVCINELTQIKCNKREILEPLLVLMAPFAPHITEELWQQLGNSQSIHQAIWPSFNEKYLVETTFLYPISINGKTRTQISFSKDLESREIEAAVIENEIVKKWLENQVPKKIIVVKNRIVNIVI
jgi:leucyl-tRNA synthetase